METPLLFIYDSFRACDGVGNLRHESAFMTDNQYTIDISNGEYTYRYISLNMLNLNYLNISDDMVLRNVFRQSRTTLMLCHVWALSLFLQIREAQYGGELV